MADWLGPWVWKKKLLAGRYGWAPPNGTLRTLDLRSLPQQAAQGPVAQGFGLFTLQDGVDAGPDYRLVPELLGTKEQETIAGVLGLPYVLAATCDDLPWHLLMMHGSPTGDTFARPLLPGTDGIVRLREHRERIAPGSPVFRIVQETLRHEYRKRLAEVQTGLAGPGQHRKWLGLQAQKLPRADRRHGWVHFVPDDLPKEEPLPPSTTITDNFDRADGALGNSAEGWSWQLTNNSIAIITNQASGGGAGGGRARAETDLSTDDHYAQIVSDNHGAGPAPMARCDPSADTSYLFHGDGGRLFKNITGTLSLLATGTNPPDPSTMKISCNGGNIQCLIDGVVDTDTPDGSIAGFLRCGIYGDNSAHMDDFQASDLSAAVRFLLTRF